MHAHGSTSERDRCRIQITPKHNSWKIKRNSQVSYRIQISNLQTKHILTSQRYSCVAKRPSTVMVIITLKSILYEKVGYHFCQVIILFWLRQKVIPDMKKPINYRNSRDPRKTANEPTGVANPGCKQHFICLTANLQIFGRRSLGYKLGCKMCRCMKKV